MTELPDHLEIEIVTQPAGASVFWGQRKSEEFRTGQVAILKKDSRGPLFAGIETYPVLIRRPGFEDVRLVVSAQQLAKYSQGKPVRIEVGDLRPKTAAAWLELHWWVLPTCEALLGVLLISATGLWLAKAQKRKKERLEQFFRSLQVGPKDDERIGTNFGRYRLLQLLGKGGMARVYRAVQLHPPHEQVAVKVLSSEAMDDKSRRRYNGEIRLSARLRHPNTVLLHEPIEEADSRGHLNLGLAMELVEGQTLKSYLAQNPCVTTANFKRIVEQMGAALSHLHSHSIVHRDIKPENFMVDQALVIKLMDFGIALETGKNRQTAWEDGVIGTLSYMPPEQILGQPLTPKTDQYSLGIMIYEMIAGRPPFVETSPQRLIHQHLSVEPIPPTFLNGDWPEAIDAPILKMLAKEPEKRHQSVEVACREVLQAAQNFSGQ